MIVSPPLDAGAVNEMSAEFVPVNVAVTDVGTPGGVIPAHVAGPYGCVAESIPAPVRSSDPQYLRSTRADAPLNTEAPTEVILIGILSVVRLDVPANATSPIEVT